MLEPSTDAPGAEETPAHAAPRQGADARRLGFGPLALAQLLAVGLVVALLGLLVWRVASGNPGAGFVSAIKRGDRPPAPAFDLPVIWSRDETWPRRLKHALDDGRVSLAELRGHPVVINFWASWCIPCKREAPALAAGARAHAGQVAFLGLDIQDFTSDARRFLRNLDVPYVSVRDSSPDSRTAYGLTGVPETYYVERTGLVVAHSIGAVSRDELERNIALAVTRE
jgi:cytochrome c biogenesis protein CcmG, thiol:disulfide interchange protein DsbE